MEGVYRSVEIEDAKMSALRFKRRHDAVVVVDRKTGLDVEVWGFPIRETDDDTR